MTAANLPKDQTPETASGGVWLASIFALTVVVGLLAAMLPARARLLGLFGPGEGLLLGAVITELSRRMNRSATLRALVAAMLCGMSAYGISTTMWWRQFAESVRDEYRFPAPNLLALQLGSPSAVESLSNAEELKAIRAQVESDPERARELDVRCSLPGFLVFRCYGVSNAARVSTKQLPAVAFWVCELAASGIVCAYLVRRQLRVDPAPTNDSNSSTSIAATST